jgi:hypothetical protein
METNVNYETISSLARIRNNDILREARSRYKRRSRASRPRRPRVRAALASAFREAGYFALTLSDMLAGG